MRRPKPHSRRRLPGPSTFPQTSSAATCRPSAAPYGALLSTAQQMTGFLHSQCRPLPELPACRRSLAAARRNQGSPSGNGGPSRDGPPARG
ncbi:hypothetical protein WJX75_004344 [Coccomyxa subellipsoidea]|uniref:Uncharacterized protein n=1 Tax=Coccomyxa subellipsoidea TaxID=248742 RepID=A0ABR2YGR3_9CHLO